MLTLRRVVLCAALVVLVASVANAQHYPLRIIRPLPVGVAGTGLDTNHRVYRAYTGIPYTIRVEAIGGRFPYTFSLAGQPTGMTIDAGPCAAVPCVGPGTITWTNPQANATPTVVVRDADGAQVSASWPINVSTTIGAGGFCFLDAANGNDTSGTGSRSAPFRTIDKAYDACGARSMVYLRAGTYALAGMPEATEECGQQITLHESARPVIFAGYPGESATIDFARTQCFQPNGQNVWFSHIRFTNCEKMCFQLIRLNRYGVTFWNNTFTGQGPGVGGLNSAFLMWAQTYGSGGVPNTQNFYDVVAGNIFTASIQGSGNSCLKMYSMLRVLVADNTFHTLSTSECVAIKSDISQFTVRGNVFAGISGPAIAGNNHRVTDQTYGEILFNNVKGASTFGLDVNQDGQAGVFYVYRNTFQASGMIHARNVDSVDGPFHVTQNVIVNTGGSGGACPQRLWCPSLSDATRLVVTNNLQGAPADNLVDANGNLIGTNTQYIGTRGHMLGESSEPPPPPPPPPPPTQPAPTVTAVTPSSGPAAGGTSVVVNGSGFVTGAIHVLFGGADAVVQSVIGSTEVRVVSPAGSGSVPVRVVNPDGQLGELASGYTYAAVPSAIALRVEATTCPNVIIYADRAPDTTGGWMATFRINNPDGTFTIASATDQTLPYQRLLHTLNPGTYTFSAVFSKSGQASVTSQLGSYVCR